MKKLVIMLLALALCLGLCACGEGQEPIASIPNELPSGPDASEGGSGEKDPENTEHTHSYKKDVVAPDCVNPGYTIHTCECGDTFESDTVEALGHTWVDATCTAPKTCSVCDATEGDVAAHNYQNGTCAGCGAADPSYKALKAASWACYKPGSSLMGMPGMSQFRLNFDGQWVWRFFEALDEPEEEFMDDWIASGQLIQLDGKYYLWQGMAEMGEFTFTESGSTVNVISEGSEDWGFTITLQRISGNQLKITAMTGDVGTFMPGLAVGDIYTCEG